MSGVHTRYNRTSAAVARKVRKQYAQMKLEAFADAIADLNTIRAASAFVGISDRTGERYMRQLCEEAGAQAQ